MFRLDFAVCLFVLLNILGAHIAHGEKYTVHLIPHSHCDPGWLQTYHVRVQFKHFFRVKAKQFLIQILAILSGSSPQHFNERLASIRKQSKEDFRLGRNVS